MSAFGYRKPADLPQAIALFPLPGAILFPRGTLPLNIFEPRYLNMVDDALSGERLIGMVQPLTGEDGAASRPHHRAIGGVVCEHQARAAPRRSGAEVLPRHRNPSREAGL